MRIIQIVPLLIAAHGSLLGASPASGPIWLPKEALFSLPQLPGLTAEWALPPNTLNELKSGISFNVEPSGALCLIAGKRAVFYPHDILMFTTDAAIEDPIWPGGRLLARSGGAIGTLELGRKDEKNVALKFKSAAPVPYRAWRLFPGTGDFFFMLGKQKNRNDISLWESRSNGAVVPVRTVYGANTPINAVTGSESRTYFASKRAVFKVQPRGAKVLFVHPAHDIRELVYVPRVGLFYSTSKSIGYIGDHEQFDFLEFPEPQIRTSGGDLYVLLGSIPNGVLQIKGLTQFRNAKATPEEESTASPED